MPLYSNMNYSYYNPPPPTPKQDLAGNVASVDLQFTYNPLTSLGPNGNNNPSDAGSSSPGGGGSSGSSGPGGGGDVSGQIGGLTNSGGLLVGR